MIVLILIICVLASSFMFAGIHLGNRTEKGKHQADEPGPSHKLSDNHNYLDDPDPYHERLRAKHRNSKDFQDFSGGMFGI